MSKDALFTVGVGGRRLPVTDICVARDTFLGKSDHPEAKDTFVILTDMRIYAGPELSECRRMLNQRVDKSTIYFAGKCPPNIRENLGLVLNSILGDAVFGG